MSFLDAAPTWFACFDQPDLKSGYELRVAAPPEWTVIGNGPSTMIESGRWLITQSKPLASYFVTLVAGPYVSVLDDHQGIPLGFHARASLDFQLGESIEDLTMITKQALGNGPSEVGRPRSLADRPRWPRSPATLSLWWPGRTSSVYDDHDGHAARVCTPAPPSATSSTGAGRRTSIEVTASPRLLPAGVRHAVPVRRIPSGVRAGLQRRRHGESGLRDASGPASLSRSGHSRRADQARRSRSRTRWPTCGSAIW